MRKVILLLMLISISLLSSLDFIPGSGRSVAPAIRDSVFAYHTNQDDHHWFGSSSWAVKFEFNEYSASFDTLEFNAEGAYIYLPGTGGSSFTLSVRPDSIGQPKRDSSTFLFNNSYTAQTGWNQVDFSQTITDTTLWLVVDYPTNSTDKFISGSANGGMQSYFLYEDYYYSLFSYSYESEFLFSLYGSFEVAGSDLELITVYWNVDDFYGDAFISPEFVIRNNSLTSVNDAYMNLSLFCPDGAIELLYNNSGNILDSLLLPVLPAGQTVNIDLSDSLHYELVRDGSQYEYSANLISAVDPLTSNNSFSQEFDTFRISQPRIMIENSLDPANVSANAIIQLQNDLLPEEFVQTINFFPDESYQPYYCDDAYTRFNFYDLMGNPATMLNGSRKIVGYVASLYENDLTYLFDEIQNTDSTFINTAQCSGTYTTEEDVTIDLQLHNQNSYVFGSYLADTTVHLAVVEDLVDFGSFPTGITVPVLRKIVGSYSNPNLGYDGTFEQSITFNRADDYVTLTSYDNCRIVYWVQNNDSKRVHYAGELPFSQLELTSIDENEITYQKLQMQISPNPYFIGNSDLKISFALPANCEKAELKIYNMKGQLVRELQSNPANQSNFITWNGKDSSSKTVANGVYLFRLKSRSSTKTSLTCKKCLILK